MFFAVAILTLALGIGANTAIFSVVHAVLLEPVAYPSEEPDRVLVMTEKSRHWDEISVAYANFKDWQRESHSCETMAGYVNGEANFTGTEEAIRLLMSHVSFSYFDVMGVVPAAGRFFTEEEDAAGAPGTLVLNHALWQNRFGGSRDVIGATVNLSDEPYTIIGILPPGFELEPRERAYTTLEQWADNDSARDRGNHQGLRVLARLADGVSFEEAVSEMETITARLESEYPDSNTGIRAKVVRLSDRRVKDYRATLWLLLGAVGLVLLVACTNVANLFLARAVGRQRELAIQAALGAGRRRLVQQGLSEGVLMALVGGALGVLLAIVGLGLLRGLLPEDVPRLHAAALNWQVLAYTFGVSLFTGVAFGAVPAFFGSRARPADPLKEGGRSTGGRGGAGRALLVVEVALATTLLVGAALLVRSLSELTRVDPGFQTDHLLTMDLGVPYSRYSGVERSRFLSERQDNLSGLPGVRSATVGLVLPMLGSSWSSIFIVGDRPVPARADLPNSLFNPVSLEYFETFEIPLLRGRLFADSDASDASKVIVVNRTLADHFWPDENPIGKRLKQGWPENEGEFNPWREVVGVIGDVKQFGLDVETRMQTFMATRVNPLRALRHD